MTAIESVDREASPGNARRAATIPERPAARLLLVDDDRDTLQVMALALEGIWENARIETALDGEEAVLKLSRMNPDLIVTDLNMPEMGGLGVCLAAKLRWGRQGAKVLVITGSRDRHASKRAFEAGADEYMTKPFTPADLRRAAIRLLEQGLLRQSENEA